jgi:hypothetical protein
MRMKSFVWTLAPVAAIGLALGCGSGEEPSAAGNPAGAANADGSAYVLSAEPAGAKSVHEVRESAEDGAQVVVVGRIGGEVEPFLDGYAGFAIIDPAVKHCGELHDEGCATPWDFCCSSPEELKDNRALVKLVDADGRAVQGDAKTLLPVKELSTVVIQGKARRDEAGNLTVEATGIHVRS